MQIEEQQLGEELSAERGDATAYTAPQAPFILHLVSPAMDASSAELALATKEAFNPLGAIYTGEVSYNFSCAISRRVWLRRSGPRNIRDCRPRTADTIPTIRFS